MTKLLIVDDEPLVRSGLRAILEGEPGLEVVGEARDGAADAENALMQLELEGRRPVDAGGATAGPKVLVLTTFGSDDYVYAALRCGASGFLLKRSRPEEIIQAVRTVASGDSVVFPEAVRQLTLPGHDGAAGRLLGTLSAREKDVLTELAAGRNNAEIASALYLSPETVKSHVASLLGKLRVRDRTQAVILAYETGFIRPGTRPSGG